MKTRITFATIVLTALIIILLSAASSQDAFADSGRRNFVGSWVVEIVLDQPGPPPFFNLATINRGKTMLASDPIVGSGNGVWKRTGRRDFSVKFLTLVPFFFPAGTPPDITSLAGTTLTVTADVTVGNSGDEASGNVHAIYTDADGNPVVEVMGNVFWTRIELD